MYFNDIAVTIYLSFHSEGGFHENTTSHNQGERGRSDLSLSLSLSLTGCGDTNAPNTPTVEQGGDIEGNNDLSNYTNADWLFQNFLGEYGLPEELKELLMPELKKMANGFALQFAQGEDVQKTIAKLNSDITMLRISGKLDVMVKSMAEGYNSKPYYHKKIPKKANTKINEKLDINITEDMKKNIQIGDEIEKEYKEEQKTLVEKYNLPYALPMERTKILIYTPNMSSRAGASKPKKKKKWRVRKKFRNVNNWNWKMADMFGTDGGKGFGHAGLVWAQSGRKSWCIDLMPSVGVKAHYNITNYINEHTSSWKVFRGYHFKPRTYFNAQDPETTHVDWEMYIWKKYNIPQAIMQWAHAQIGKRGYYIDFDKDTDGATYCSAFVWQAYYNTSSVDLDSDGKIFVTPSDLFATPGVVNFATESRKYRSY